MSGTTRPSTLDLTNDCERSTHTREPRRRSRQVTISNGSTVLRQLMQEATGFDIATTGSVNGFDDVRCGGNDSLDE